MNMKAEIGDASGVQGCPAWPSHTSSGQREMHGWALQALLEWSRPVLAQESVGPSVPDIPTLLCLPTSPVHRSLELWVVQILSNLSYIFWLLETSVGCVEKTEMVTKRRWKKSEQQPRP